MALSNLLADDTSDADPVDTKPVRFAAYAFMLSMPWAGVFLERLNPHDVARMFESVVLCLAAWIWVRRWRAIGLPAKSAKWLLIGIGIAGSVSVMLAEHRIYAGLEASAAVLLLLTAFAFASTPLPILLREVPAVVAAAALLSVLLELPRLVFFLVDGRVPQAGDFGFMYMNHRFLNHAQTVILPLTLCCLLIPTARWVRIAAWIGVAGGLALLWRTGGRGTLLAMVFVAVGLPCLLRARANEVVRRMVFAVLAAVVVYGACFVLPAMALDLQANHEGSAGQRLLGVNDAARLHLWRLAWNDTLQHPWFGVGPMHYAHQPNDVAAHPHNALLQLTAEWGLPTALTAVAFFGFLMFRCARGVRNAPPASRSRVLLAAGWVAVAAGSIDSLVSGTLVMPVSQLWWVIALGLTLAGTWPLAAAQRSGTVVRATAAALLGLLTASHVAWSVMTYHRATDPALVDGPLPQRTNVPRYWINGFF